MKTGDVAALRTPESGLSLVLMSYRGIEMRWRLFLTYVVLLSAAGKSLRAQQHLTLADVLQQESIPFPPASIPRLNALITSYATLNDSQGFLVAYYLADPGTDTLRPPLCLARYSKATGRWRDVALEPEQIQQASRLKDWNIGSVQSLTRRGTNYYLQIHWGPSAGSILILTDDLSVRDAVGGWTRGWYKSGDVLYEGNMTHFVEVKPETLWLYDAESRESRELYPQPDDPLRNAFSAKLAKVIDENRCRLRNWDCNPKNFSTEIDEVELNDETRALAARVRFYAEGFLDRDEAENSGKFDDDDYVYIYQLQPFRWREFSVYDLKPKFGTDSLKELLTPGKIDAVFATPAPN